MKIPVKSALFLASTLFVGSTWAMPVNFAFETNVDASVFGGGTADLFRIDWTVDADSDLVGTTARASGYRSEGTISIGTESSGAEIYTTLGRTDNPLSPDYFGIAGFGGSLFGRNLSVFEFVLRDTSTSSPLSLMLPNAQDANRYDSLNYAVSLSSIGGFSKIGSGGFVSIDSTNFRLSSSVSTVPEPSSLALLGLGAVGMIYTRKRKNVPAQHCIRSSWACQVRVR